MKLNQNNKEKCYHKRIKTNKNILTQKFPDISLDNEIHLINEDTNPNSFIIGIDGKIQIKTNNTRINLLNNNQNNDKNKEKKENIENDISQFILESEQNGIIWLHLPSNNSNRINSSFSHPPPPRPPPTSSSISKNKNNNKNMKTNSSEKITNQKRNKSCEIQNYFIDSSKKGLIELEKYLSNNRKLNNYRTNIHDRFDTNDMSYENLLRLDERPPTSQDISRTGLSLKDSNKIMSVIINSSTSQHTDNQLICSVCQDEFYHENAICLPKCQHIFHGKCIGPWFLTHTDCPNCRQRVV